MLSEIPFLELIPAMQKPGCPICRLRDEHEQRCLENLLLDHIVDGVTMELLSSSSGFCSKHTWLMGLLEISNYQDAIKNSMVYEYLLKKMLIQLTEYYDNESHWVLPKKIKWHMNSHKGRCSFTKDPIMSMAKNGCYICQLGEEVEHIHLSSLILGLGEGKENIRKMYLASDGLCLTHFRQAFNLENITSSEGLKFLVETTISKLAQLRNDVTNYIDKHAWNRSHERFSTGEINSYIRLFRFFGKNEEALLNNYWSFVDLNEKVPQKNL